MKRTTTQHEVEKFGRGGNGSWFGYGAPRGGLVSRRERAAARLAALRDAAPEHRFQAYDSWLQVATAAEVRRAWRSWMGAKMPGWAVAS